MFGRISFSFLFFILLQGYFNPGHSCYAQSGQNEPTAIQILATSSSKGHLWMSGG